MGYLRNGADLMSAIQQMLIGSSRGGTTLMSALTTAALTTNLKLCLDARDASSYDPAVQTDKWLDVAGSGYDFYRGSGTGGDAADPTFNGEAGGLESNWSFDGGDYFTYDVANEVWMESIHKNNAIFSIVAFFMPQVGAQAIIGNSKINTGFEVLCNSSTYLSIDNAGANVLTKVGDTAVTNNAYHMIGVSLNEATGAGGGFFYLDGAYNQVSASNTFNSTYTAPAAGAASHTLQIAAGGTAYLPMKASSKMACIAVWQGTALTKANMDTIWAAMRGRFGI